MNPVQVLRYVADKFRKNQIEEAENEAIVLLCHILNCSKASLYANTEFEIASDKLDRLDELLSRRLNHEPMAYIIKNKEFYGIDLYVDSRVLIPRPETETLVESVIDFAESGRFAESESGLAIADVGTGSGSIVVALAKHLKNARIYATDISEAALQVASVNLVRHGLEDRITLFQGNLLQSLKIMLNIVVANLPYIESEAIGFLPPEIKMYEPHAALDGGIEGTGLYGDLIKQAGDRLTADGAIFMEIGKDQGDAIGALCREIMPEAKITYINDLRGVKRVVRVIKS